MFSKGSCPSDPQGWKWPVILIDILLKLYLQQSSSLWADPLASLSFRSVLLTDTAPLAVSGTRGSASLIPSRPPAHRGHSALPPQPSYSQLAASPPRTHPLSLPTPIPTPQFKDQPKTQHVGPGVYRTGNVSMELKTLKKEELSKVPTLRMKELSKVNTSENSQVSKLSVCSTRGPGSGSAKSPPEPLQNKCAMFHLTQDI